MVKNIGLFNLVKSTSKYPAYLHTSWNLRFPNRSLGNLYRYVQLSLHVKQGKIVGLRLEAEIHRYFDPRPLLREQGVNPTKKNIAAFYEGLRESVNDGK